jgi:hypothetical protein
MNSRCWPVAAAPLMIAAAAAAEAIALSSSPRSNDARAAW